MMRTSLRNSRANGGFTLLELLVSTAVGAVVLLVINATFFGALKLHNSTHDRIDQDLSLQRSLSIVRQDLAGIMLPRGLLTGQLQTTAFSSAVQDVEGDRISPDLYTNSGKIDGWTPFADVQMVAYYLAPARDGGMNKDLVRAVTRNLLPVQENIPEQQTLLTGIASAEMAFYDGVEWTSEWDSEATSTLPTAIRLTLELAASDLNAQPPAPIELLVPVVVTTRTSQSLQLAAVEP